MAISLTPGQVLIIDERIRVVVKYVEGRRVGLDVDGHETVRREGEKETKEEMVK